MIDLAGQLVKTNREAAEAAKAGTGRKPDPTLAARVIALSQQLKAAETALNDALIKAEALCYFSNACFASGTPLRTPGGWRAIEDVRVGDLVLSRDEHDPSGPVVGKVVEELFRRTGQVWHLTVGGRLVRTSGGHPFYAWDRGWVGCNELRAGDTLLCEDGTWQPVEEVVNTGTWEVVYNLRVADHHIYFVGKGDWGFAVWAHNMCDPEVVKFRTDHGLTVIPDSDGNPKDSEYSSTVAKVVVGGVTYYGVNYFA